MEPLVREMGLDMRKSLQTNIIDREKSFFGWYYGT